MTTVTPRPKAKPRKTKKKQSLSKEADRLFSLIIRGRGKCESGRLARHSGVLQCAHGFSRRYRAVRWDQRQCWSLCAACHMYFTHHPIEWDLWMRETLGEELYEEIRATALAGVMPDLAELVAELKQEAIRAA